MHDKPRLRLAMALFVEVLTGLAVLFALQSCYRHAGSRHVVGAPGLGAQYNPPLYLSGTSGTVTVPAGDYVVLITAHSTAGGSVIPTCNTAQISDAGPLGTWTVAAGGALTLGPPLLPTSPYACADGSTIVFTSTDSYIVWLTRYVYP